MGATHVTVTIRNPADPKKSWEGLFLVDSGAIDSLVPKDHLEAIGLKPKAQRIYELANGSEIKRDITTGNIEFMGEIVDGTIIFADSIKSGNCTCMNNIENNQFIIKKLIDKDVILFKDDTSEFALCPGFFSANSIFFRETGKGISKLVKFTYKFIGSYWITPSLNIITKLVNRCSCPFFISYFDGSFSHDFSLNFKEYSIASSAAIDGLSSASAIISSHSSSVADRVGLIQSYPSSSIFTDSTKLSCPAIFMKRLAFVGLSIVTITFCILIIFTKLQI